MAGTKASTIARGALAFALSAACAPAFAADFYAGKTLNFVINFTAGGPTDLEGRLAAKYLARHIAGAPNVVVRNMAGAGGAIGVNWLGEIAQADGTNVGFFTSLASSAAIAAPSIRVEPSKFVFVAGGPGVSVAYARTDIAPGLKTPADIMKAKDFWIGGLAPDSDKDLRIRLQFDMLGLKYRYISNYPGSNEARLAIAQNEIQVFPESMPTYRATIEPMVAMGQVIPLWHDSLDDGENFSASPDAAGIPAPTYTDFLKRQKGGFPTGIEWDAFKLINSAGTVFLRSVAMPPGTPKEASDALRAAFAAVTKDEEFKAEAVKILKFAPRYLVDDKTEALYREKLKPNARIAAFMKDYIEKGRASLGK
jgi:tripartite-type tricarboxylate transporter receptor subunit TctC